MIKKYLRQDRNEILQFLLPPLGDWRHDKYLSMHLKYTLDQCGGVWPSPWRILIVVDDDDGGDSGDADAVYNNNLNFI